MSAKPAAWFTTAQRSHPNAHVCRCRSRRTIDFAYDPDEDTPERVADEITSLFELSSTDRDICAAALKEWLAKELPDNDSS